MMFQREYCCVTKEGEEHYFDAYNAEQAISMCENRYGEVVTECYLVNDVPDEDSEKEESLC